VRGLAGSLTLGGETRLAIAQFIKQATGHLNIAFDCTLVALGLSVVLMFLLHAVQREEEGLVIDCQQYCLEHLVTRLYDLEAPAPSVETRARAVPGPIPLTDVPAGRRLVS